MLIGDFFKALALEIPAAACNLNCALYLAVKYVEGYRRCFKQDVLVVQAMRFGFKGASGAERELNRIWLES